MPSRDPRRAWIIPALIPAALAALWLAAIAADALPDALFIGSWFIPVPLLTLMLAIVLLGLSLRQGRAGLRGVALVVVCAAAPLALLYPWTMATKIPGSVGDFRYFLVWLTRYPNFGPVNIEVLAGIAAMFAVGFLLALVSALYLMRAPRRTMQLAAVLSVIAYGPVLSRLDIALIAISDIWFEASWYRPITAYGPALRAMAVAASLLLAFAPASALASVSPPPPGSRPAHR